MTFKKSGRVDVIGKPIEVKDLKKVEKKEAEKEDKRKKK